MLRHFKLILKNMKLVYFWWIFISWCSWFSYEYNFATYSGGVVRNSKAGDGNPVAENSYRHRYWDWGWKTNSRSTDPIHTEQGVLILNDDVMGTSGNVNLGTTLTAWFTIFIFTKNQVSDVFSLYDDDGIDNILELLIDNGKMRVRTIQRYEGAFNSVWYTQNSDSNGDDTTMYEPGWNLLWYVTGGNWNFYSYPHFQTSPKIDTASYYSFHGEGKRGMFGGVKETGSIERELEGIIHSAYFEESRYSDSQIRSNYLPPRSSPFVCDYFTGMFADLTTTDTNDYFPNKLSNYNGNVQTFRNSNSAVLDATNGLPISSGQTYTIENVKATDQRALSVQLWFKGVFSTGQRIVSFSKDGSNKNLYMTRSGSDLVFTTTDSTTVTITFSGALAPIISGAWVYIGMSVGWLGRGDNFMICAYIFQETRYENGKWKWTVVSTNLPPGQTISLDFGPGMNGHIHEVYTSNHLEHFEMFKLFKYTFGIYRYKWFPPSKLQIDPYRSINGWGNGYIMASETSETWDDGNTDNGDGCSSTWTREPLWKCTAEIGPGGSHLCEYMWANGKSVF
jgi:cysteine-rich repeat protein